jgi:GAF domain-containing protein
VHVRDAGLDWARARDLADTFKLLVTSESVRSTADRVCQLAVAHIPGSDDAGVSLVDRFGVRTLGATSTRPVTIDELQDRFGEGPGVDVTRPGADQMVSCGHLEQDRRWPQFGPAVAAAGVRSMLAFRLGGSGQAVGALSIYSERVDAFQSAAVLELGALFSAHAAIAVTGAQAIENLRAALETRETISVAIGVLMGRQAVSREQAFEILRRASQRENVKLRDIAARLAGPGSVL